MAEIETKKWKNTTFESGFLKKWVAKTPLLKVGFKSAKHHKNTIFESGCNSRNVSISNTGYPRKSGNTQVGWHALGLSKKKWKPSSWFACIVLQIDMQSIVACVVEIKMACKYL